ncbi:MAG TPA: AAA family ATPase [Candidatus Acidoferrales bacterium]|jgi:predicted kinase|nr:AAA family ATPase [Candidatus Acidoferrales bacterium]
MTPEAILFVGIQGSGKTTFYRERFADTHVRINLDMLRARRREQLLLEACLKGGQSFVVDNTNPSAADRAKYIAPARTAGFRVIAYFFQTELRDAIRRNNQRRGKQKIPVVALAGTLKKLQPPAKDEGFDHVYRVEIDAENCFVVTG